MKFLLHPFPSPGKGFETVLFSILLSCIILLGCCTHLLKLVFIVFSMLVAVFSFKKLHALRAISFVDRISSVDLQSNKSQSSFNFDRSNEEAKI